MKVSVRRWQDCFCSPRQPRVVGAIVVNHHRGLPNCRLLKRTRSVEETVLATSSKVKEKMSSRDPLWTIYPWQGF